jgi:hypothetical protein
LLSVTIDERPFVLDVYEVANTGGGTRRTPPPLFRLTFGGYNCDSSIELVRQQAPPSA